MKIRIPSATTPSTMNNPSRHLYDIITSKIIDPWKEYDRLKHLFFEDTFWGYGRLLPLKDYIGDVFRIMPIRGTAPDIEPFFTIHSQNVIGIIAN